MQPDSSPGLPRRLLFVLLLCLIGSGSVGCRRSREPDAYQGYLEAEYVYLGSPLGGNLVGLHVRRGDGVKAGQRLFELDPEPETLLRDEARLALDQSTARLADLRKGRRPSEIQSLQARLDQSAASLRLAELEWSRIEQLHKENVASVDQLDRARTSLDFYRAQRQQLTSEIETARLGARPDEILAAEAGVEAAKTAVERAEWAVGRKVGLAPAAAAVHDTLYRPGEWVAPGNPVVVLLPPSHIKVRFFVPQEALSRVPPGSVVRVSFDGRATPLEARVNYVSTEAEFTPPVIYSQLTRAKLVFMVEAGIAGELADGLRPGQPVDVFPAP